MSESKEIEKCDNKDCIFYAKYMDNHCAIIPDIKECEGHIVEDNLEEESK